MLPGATEYSCSIEHDTWLIRPRSAGNNALYRALMTFILRLTRVSDLPCGTKAARTPLAKFRAKTADRGPVLGKSLASSAAKHARFRHSAGQSAANSLIMLRCPGSRSRSNVWDCPGSTALAALRSCLYVVLGFTKQASLGTARLSVCLGG